MRRGGKAHRSLAAVVAEVARRLWEDLRGQIHLGGGAFVERMRTRIAEPEALSDAARAQRAPAPRLLGVSAEAGGAQAAVMAVAYVNGGYTLRAIARHLGVHESTVSRAVRCVSA